MTPDQVKLVVSRQTPEGRAFMLSSMQLSSLRMDRWVKSGEGLTEEELEHVRDWAMGRYVMTPNGMKPMRRAKPQVHAQQRPPLLTRVGGPVVSYGDPAAGVMAVPGAMKVMPAARNGKDLPSNEALKEQARRRAEAEAEKARRKPGSIGSLMNFGRTA